MGVCFNVPWIRPPWWCQWLSVDTAEQLEQARAMV